MVAVSTATDCDECSGVVMDAQPDRATSEMTDAGEQAVIPGVAPVTLRERLERRTASPLLPRKLQKPLDFGLFDLNARNQIEMF